MAALCCIRTYAACYNKAAKESSTTVFSYKRLSIMHIKHNAATQCVLLCAVPNRQKANHSRNITEGRKPHTQCEIVMTLIAGVP